MFEFLNVVIAGAAAIIGPLLFKKYWPGFREWLNNNALDIIEKKLGYDARKTIERAESRVTRIHDKLEHLTTVNIGRKSVLDTSYRKVTFKTTAPLYNQSNEVQDAFKKEDHDARAFAYELY